MATSPEPSPCPLEGSVDRHVAALMDTLARIGPIITERVILPGSHVALEIARPSDTDLLLDRSATDPEQNLPYWAEIWPSGLALAGAIQTMPEQVAGHRCIELGCGLGVTAAVAVAHGADLTVTDYAPEALTLSRINTLRHAGREPALWRQNNWRSENLDNALTNRRYPVVLAADVLYERRDIEPLLHAIDRLLTPDGLLWLSDPHRKPADVVLDRLQEGGWQVETTRWSGPWPDPADSGVTVRTHRIRRAGTRTP